jgi:hypothetical protein
MQLLPIPALILVLFSAQALAKKPSPPPPPPDPCISPSVVTAATFPAYIFARNTTVKNGPRTISTFLADATGQCEKKVTESWPGEQRVDIRFDADTGLLLVLGDEMVARMIRVTFSPTGGPSVALLGAPFVLLDDSELAIPADLASDGWTAGGTSDPRISADGTRVLFHRGYGKETPTLSWSLNTFWTCDLAYDASWQIQPINPASCIEVYRAPVNDNDNWGSHASWGAIDGTIYVTQPSSADVRQLSLYRLTLPPTNPPNIVEIFNSGGVFDYPRAVSTDDPAASNGELVAAYDLARPSNNWCGRVYIIDAYEDCGSSHSCTVLSNQGQGSLLRSATWLPDGRIAGQGESAPNRQGRCSATGTLNAFPAVDPHGASATHLTTGGNIEGAGGE